MSHAGLILASASPRRRDLIASLGFAFEVIPPHLDEPTARPPDASPRSWAIALAYFKARSVYLQRPDRLVLGADTIVVADGEILGKPRDLADARRMLEMQAGRVSEVLTGLAMLSPASNDGPPPRILEIARTRVWMRREPAAIDAYLLSGDWQGKAGAYGIQDVGDRLVERIEGSFSNVVGLPLERVRLLVESAHLRQPI